MVLEVIKPRALVFAALTLTSMLTEFQEALSNVYFFALERRDTLAPPLLAPRLLRSVILPLSSRFSCAFFRLCPRATFLNYQTRPLTFIAVIKTARIVHLTGAVCFQAQV